MPATYTTSLRLAKPAVGDTGWGTTVNSGLTDLVDASVAGATSVTMTAANYTLSNNNGTTDEARAMFLVLNGTPGASYNVICPAASKLYFVTNNTGFAQTVKTSAGSGVSVPNGARMTLRCDGTDVVAAQNYFASLSLGAALPIASGGTGSTSTTYCSLTTNVAGTLPTSNGGTGSTATTYCSLTANVTGTLPIANGGTGSTSTTYCSLTTNVTGTLPTANGGTGLTAGTSGGVMYFSATNTLASSAVLAANALVVGGGAGVAPSTIATGTGVVTALGVNTGTAGAVVVNGGALGTPASGTLTNVTGLPLSTGVTGTLSPANGGTGVANNSANTLTFSGAFGLTLTLSGTTSVTLPTSGTLSTLAGTETLTNKRITARVSSTASITSPLAWNSNSFDQYAATAQAGALTLNADAGTPTDGQRIIFRLKDNGTARALTWTTGVSNGFRAIGVTLPTTTVINKTVYVGCIYNSADSRWDAVAVAQEA